MQIELKPGRLFRAGTTPEICQANGGYFSELFVEQEQLDEWDLKCPVCFDVVRDPLEIGVCGHVFCTVCVRKITAETGTVTECPLDKTTFTHRDLKLSKYLSRKIDDMKVNCINKNKGCVWIGPLRELLEHSQICDSRLHNCDKCFEAVTGTKMAQHQKKTCHFRLVNCASCSSAYQYIQKQDHLDICSHALIHCPHNCGSADILRKDLPLHLNGCLEHPITCKYIKLGCSASFLRKEEAKHNEETKSSHFQLLDEYYSTMVKKHDNLQHHTNNLQVAVIQKDRQIKELTEESKTLKYLANIVEPEKKEQDISYGHPPKPPRTRRRSGPKQRPMPMSRDDFLLDQPFAKTRYSRVQEKKILEVMQEGNVEREKAVEALTRCKWNTQEAVLSYSHSSTFIHDVISVMMCSESTARKALEDHNWNVQEAIAALLSGDCD